MLDRGVVIEDVEAFDACPLDCEESPVVDFQDLRIDLRTLLFSTGVGGGWEVEGGRVLVTEGGRVCCIDGGRVATGVGDG